MVEMQVGTLRSFGQRVELEASRSLDLLNAIDSTIYACNVLKETIDALASEAHKYISSVKHSEHQPDADGTALAKLETARDALGELYRIFTAKCASARGDVRLSEEDGVVEAIEQLLDSIADAHNTVNELCWAVGERSADFDKPLEGEFESAEDLFKAMGV